MKFKSFQVSSQLGRVNAGTSDFHYSNPGAMAEAKESGNLGVTIGKGVMGMVDRVNTAKALEANNYYNQRMSEATAEIMNNHKEGNALDVVTMYDDRQKKVMDDVQKRFGNYIKFGPAADAFREYTMKDNATRRGNMERYQTAELEKYQDSVFSNGMHTCVQAALDGGYANDAIDGALNRMDSLIAIRYGAYGEERMKEARLKYGGNIASQAIEEALALNDIARVDALAARYQGLIPPATRQKAMAIKGKREKADREILFNQQGVAALGINATYADCEAYIKANNIPVNAASIHTFYGKTEGMPYNLGGAEDGSDGTWDCGSWTKAAYAQAGMALNSRCADDQYDQMVAEGRAFHKASELRDGDLVFWTHTGGEEGDNGVAHVGIYNAQSGKVMQSGTRGVGEIEVDTYDVVGFGHADKGDGRILSPSEAKEKTDSLFQAIHKAKTMQHEQDTNQINNGRLALAKLVNEATANGGTVSLQDALAAAGNFYTGRDEVDVVLETAAYAAAGITGRRAGSGSGTGGTGGTGSADSTKVPAGFEYDFSNMVRSGKFDNPMQAMEYVSQAANDGYYNKGMYDKAFKVIEDWSQRKGTFSIDKAPQIKQSVMAQLGGKAERYPGIELEYEQALDIVYQTDYQEYQQKHGRPMPPSEIVAAVLSTMLNTVEYYDPDKGFFGGTREISRVRLGNSGLQFIDFDRNGNYMVRDLNGGGTYSLTEEEIKRIDNSSGYWKDALGK